MFFLFFFFFSNDYNFFQFEELKKNFAVQKKITKNIFFGSDRNVVMVLFVSRCFCFSGVFGLWFDACSFLRQFTEVHYIIHTFLFCTV